MTLESRISELAKAAKPAVAIIGLGGAGCNIISWIAQKEMLESKIIAADTDATHLMSAKADVKILLGEQAYQGKGCGGFAERGIEAARESIKEIQKELAGSNLVFIIAGRGGGSGTGAAPVVAEATREAGILTMGCVMLPFGYEILRRKKALLGIKALAAQCDSLVNLDYSDLRSVVERGGISAIGTGDAEGENRIEKAMEHALSTPLLDVSDISSRTN